MTKAKVMVPDLIDVLTLGGVIRGRHIRVADMPPGEDREGMQEMLSGYSKAQDIPEDQLLMLIDVELTLGSRSIEVQPWLVLQRSAVLGVFSGPVDHTSLNTPER